MVVPGHGKAHNSRHDRARVDANPQLESVGGPVGYPEIMDGSKQLHS